MTIAPESYPVVIGVGHSTLPCWAVMAAVRGAEPSEPPQSEEALAGGQSPLPNRVPFVLCDSAPYCERIR
jgi:hypothetical protein